MWVLLDREDVFAGLEVEGKCLDVRLASNCRREKDRGDDIWQLNVRVNSFLRGMKGVYRVYKGRDFDIAGTTYDFCMEIVFLVVWFICYDFEFGEFLGGWIVCTVFGRASVIDDERMGSLGIVHFGMLMRCILEVVTCSIVASETHIDSIWAILKSAAGTRKEHQARENAGELLRPPRRRGRYLVIKALSTFLFVHKLAGTRWDNACDMRTRAR